MRKINATEPSIILAGPLSHLLTEEQWERIASETGVSEVAVEIVTELQKQSARELPAAKVLLTNWTGTSVRHSAVREALRALLRGRPLLRLGRSRRRRSGSGQCH